MKENWKRFVFDLIEAKKANLDEDGYHKLIENQFQLLGWSKYNGEICHKSSLAVGHTHIVPDIVIKRDGDVQYVIEVKRPDHKISKHDIIQLESYIRQLKKKVGIYIGEHIEVFYDKPDSDKALSVLRIPLDMDSKRGPRFIDLFSKENFTTDSIVAFCEDRLLEMQRQESLNKVKDDLIANTNAQVSESLLPYLMEKYNGTFTEDDIKSMLAELTFMAMPKNGAITPVVEPVLPVRPKSTQLSDNVWMLCYDKNSFDVEGCLNKLGQVYWHYTDNTKSISRGDVIYLYSSSPEKAIRFKVEVIDDHIPYSPIMNVEDEFDASGESNQDHNSEYFLVRFVAETHSTALTHKIMFEGGIIGRRPTVTMLSKPEYKKRLDYIEAHFINKGEEPIEFKTFMKKAAAVATMDYYPSSKRYVIKKGSHILDATKESCRDNLAKLREEIKGDSKLSVKEGEAYRLLQDIELKGVTSPTGAAVFCWGSSRPGPDDWGDKDGQRYPSEWWK